MTNLQISGIGPKDFVGRTGGARVASSHAPFAGVTDGYTAGEIDTPSIYKCSPSTGETSGRGFVVRTDVASHVLAAMGVPAMVAAHAQTC
ncbi:MAG: hypothetical protein ACYCW6_19430 [Candidatus Xenobia bacterium]